MSPQPHKKRIRELKPVKAWAIVDKKDNSFGYGNDNTINSPHYWIYPKKKLAISETKDRFYNGMEPKDWLERVIPVLITPIKVAKTNQGKK